MSSLWHDADYLPDKSIHVPSVVKHFDNEAPLPSEQHQLPKGFDAFSKLDEVYEVAAQQMDRGLEGQAFLHGKKAPPSIAESTLDRSASGVPADEVTRTMMAHKVAINEADRKLDGLAVQEARATDAQLEKRDQVSAQPTKVSNATQSATAGQDSARALKALEMAEGIGIPAALAPVTQGVGVDPATGSIAAEAASVVKAVTTAKTAVGMTKAMDETSDISRSEHLKRAIDTRRNIEHQPSLDPGDPSSEPSSED
jgi:hypothetical protein